MSELLAFNATVSPGLAELLLPRLPAGVVQTPPPGRPRVSRAKLVSSILSDLSCCHLAFFCSNPGHGATSVATDVAYRLGSLDRPPLFLDVTELRPSSQPEVFAQVDGLLTEQRVDSEDEELVLVVDGLHGLDERDCVHIAKMVTRLVRRATVILLGGAECALLSDVLPEHRCVKAHDLLALRSELVAWAQGLEDEKTLKDLFDATGGIPCLVESRVMATAPRDDPSQRHAAYRRRRASLLLDAVAGPIIDEERRLRCALVLLGEGTIAEVQALGVRCVPEIVSSSREECPVLGIDALGARFSAVGSYTCPAACVDEAAWRYPDLVFDIVQHLVSRGSFAQAIAVADRCVDSVDMLSVAAAFPVELFDAGGASLLHATLAAAHESECSDVDLRRVSAVLDVADGRTPDLSERALGAGAVPEQIRLLRRVCGLYETGVGALGRVLPADKGEGGVAWLVRDASRSRLAAHLRARAHILRGDFAGVLRVLAREEGRPSGPLTLGGALLTVDSYLCARLQGRSVSLGEKGALADALAFLRTSMPEPWASYEEAFCWVADTACGAGVSGVGWADALAMARRRGDEAVASIVQCGMALADLASGNFDSASAHAQASLEGPGGPWAASCCSLVVAMGRARADGCWGDDEEWPGEPLGAAAEAVAYGLSGSRDKARERRVRARLASERCDAASALLMKTALAMEDEGLWRLLPESWRRPLRARTPGASRLAPAPEHARVQVSVLGKSRVTVDGQVLEPRSWRRGSARALVAYLAVKEGHMAYRSEIVPAFWPDRKSEECLPVFYQMMSAARRALGGPKSGPQPLQGRNGIVALSEDLVECDIDRLRDLLATVLGPGPEDERLDAALSAMALYAGGLHVPRTGPGFQFFSAEHDLLESRYVDALLRAASLSPGCSREHDGIVLAQAAYGLCPGRDDVAACYVRLLLDVGRCSEAAQVCLEHRQKTRSLLGSGPAPEFEALFLEVKQRVRGLCLTVE
ncbi:hypothetical protein AAK967_06290 [Atopobiaceae bacterium 24-176]